MPYCHLLGKGWPLGSRLWCLIVTLSLSHLYPGSGVVLDCIDSWSLPSFLLCCQLQAKVCAWSTSLPLSQAWPGKSADRWSNCPEITKAVDFKPKMNCLIIEPWHGISNNVVCAISTGSDPPAHTRSLIRALASRLIIIWILSYWPNIIWSF